MEEKKEVPVFIKIDEYKDIVDVVNLIKEKIQEANEHMGNIDELRRQENNEMASWRADLAEIERNIDDTDKKLFKR